ncbi:hypothetical protein BRDID11002_63390 [Bradyrhizobium diazoefficiens]
MTQPRSAALASRKDGGLLILPDFFTMANRAHLLAAVREARVPAVFWSRTFVDEGGLMSYSTDSAEQLRRAAGYIDRILKGAQAADLPVQNPHQVRARGQPQGRQGAWRHHSPRLARNRERRHRIKSSVTDDMSGFVNFRR